MARPLLTLLVLSLFFWTFGATPIANAQPRSAALADHRPVVDYAMGPVLAEGRLVGLAVELRFRAGPGRETVLELPDAWGGEAQLWRAVKDLEVAGATLHPGAGPALRVLRHAPAAEVTVRYRLVQESPAPFRAGPEQNHYRPALGADWFHILGNAAFAEVRGRNSNDWPARFSWRGEASGWALISDLEHPGLTVGDVIDSVSVGGAYRLETRDLGGAPLRVALRGDWRFADIDFADRVGRIVRAQRAYWGDPPSPFLVTVSPLEGRPDWVSIGGTGRGDAFAFFATANADEATLDRILTHEKLHTWIPAAVGGLPVTDEAQDYWLSEGFTEFLTFRLLVRVGLWTVEDFADALNEELAAYAANPERAAPNARVVEAFWTSRDVERLPYVRGMLMAMAWDAALRARSGGRADLDEVLLAMRAAASAAGPAARTRAVDLFRAEMARRGVPAEAGVAQLLAGADIRLPEDLLAPCGRIEGAAAQSLALDPATAAAGPARTACERRLAGL